MLKTYNGPLGGGGPPMGKGVPLDPNTSARGRGTPADAIRMGRTLARRLQRSVPKPIPLKTFAIAGRLWQVGLPLAVPSLSVLKKVKEEERRKRDNEAGPAAAMHSLMLEWACRAEAAIRSGRALTTQRIPLQLLRLGPVHIVGAPMEVYAGVGAELRKALAPQTVWVVSGANGTVNYLPTPIAYERGAYSAHFAPRIYGLFGYRADVTDVVVDSVLAHVRAR